MERRTVQLRVGGQSYKVVTSASDYELERLAASVDAKVAEVTPKGRVVTPQAMLLAAMSLAHELETERDRRAALERRTRDLLRRALVRIDGALDDVGREPALARPPGRGLAGTPGPGAGGQGS